jgi:hypothetical protein
VKTARRIAATEALVGVCGLATIVLSVDTGNLPLLFAAVAVVVGGGDPIVGLGGGAFYVSAAPLVATLARGLQSD